MNLNSIVNMVMRRLVNQGINSAMRKGTDMMSQRGQAGPQRDPLAEREEALARRERELALEQRERELAAREAQLRNDRDA
ncbi:hypothetical protein [Pontivivens insulae]|uniref:Uncharacterized protein n=1 Tax=Pontivivens insulae TaxID=1639689 RepID=A0A2R8ACU7_9RHOB|nr:hypothetical protein [Pontivivens insulae]RED13831.1 hypothetical protein DFR53_1177 [Pontivivens insulae]SPF29905.1 hypothetical protein POI8812_02231 [Pontivivens insulae]